MGDKRSFGMVNIAADQFVDAATGIKQVYGIVGDGLNRLSNAVQRQGKVEWRTGAPLIAFSRFRFSTCLCCSRRCWSVRSAIDGHPSSLRALLRVPPHLSEAEMASSPAPSSISIRAGEV
jgi:hypothetical protein